MSTIKIDYTFGFKLLPTRRFIRVDGHCTIMSKKLKPRTLCTISGSDRIFMADTLYYYKYLGNYNIKKV
jgi:hypothetical protein